MLCHPLAGRHGAGVASGWRPPAVGTQGHKQRNYNLASDVRFAAFGRVTPRSGFQRDHQPPGSHTAQSGSEEDSEGLVGHLHRWHTSAVRGKISDFLRGFNIGFRVHVLEAYTIKMNKYIRFIKKG